MYVCMYIYKHNTWVKYGLNQNIPFPEKKTPNGGQNMSKLGAYLGFFTPNSWPLGEFNTKGDVHLLVDGSSLIDRILCH